MTLETLHIRAKVISITGKAHIQEIDSMAKRIAEAEGLFMIDAYERIYDAVAYRGEMPAIEQVRSIYPTLKYYCDGRRHLVCAPYSLQYLHLMAHDLGIDRCWFHRDHYDIPKQRIKEITEKCEVVDSKKILEIIGQNRRRKQRRK